MKKTIVSALTLLVLSANLQADIISNLDNYTRLECTFEERQATHKNRHQHSSGRPHPHMPIEKGTSINWSGYASATDIENPTNGTVSEVSGFWTVPALQPTPDNSFTAIWVGIDGFSSPTVEQLGTEHDWSSGKQQNSAWFEMYPNPSFQINGFPLEVGDLIQAEVSYQGDQQFQLSIVNHTQNHFTVIPASLTKSTVAKRSSAEWILEAPFSSEVLPLSDFQEVVFHHCIATISGEKGGIMHKGWQADAINMATTDGVVKATTSSLTPDEQSFTITWAHE
jgi:hypothetical protein